MNNIKIFTGLGKGKTTAAFGFALRALAQGKRVLIIQFLKPPRSCGEHFGSERLQNLTVKAMGRGGFVSRRDPHPVDVALAGGALQEAMKRILSGDYDFVILDEIVVAMDLGLIAKEDVADLLRSKPEAVELVLTGRNASEFLSAFADSVVEMQNVRHPYDSGLKARKGIEF
jgi:cob(I)alamin adenosyltransferase